MKIMDRENYTKRTVGRWQGQRERRRDTTGHPACLPPRMVGPWSPQTQKTYQGRQTFVRKSKHLPHGSDTFELRGSHEASSGRASPGFDMEHDGWEAEVIREVARRLTEGEMYHYALARARMQSSQACASGVIESSRGRRWDERGADMGKRSG